MPATSEEAIVAIASITATFTDGLPTPPASEPPTAFSTAPYATATGTFSNFYSPRGDSPTQLSTKEAS